jgi:ribosomal-protein-alanine N-acetyltransferase
MVTTERLLLRQVQEEDADFLVALTNDPDFLRFIGDRSIRTRDDAIAYLRTGPFLRAPGLLGLCVVVAKSSGRPLGVCGLLQREGLADVDLGFAFLPEHRGHGYAFEAASAMLQYGARRLQLSRVVAIVDPANERSIALLGRLGMRFERQLHLAPAEKLLHLYCATL